MSSQNLSTGLIMEDSSTEESLLKEGIPRIPAKNLSDDEFQRKYMEANKPVIITGICDNWECYKKWTKNHSINFEYLKSAFKDRLIPVANCTKQYFNSHEKSEMNLLDYLHWWQDRATGKETGDTLLYLKDWHLQQEVEQESGEPFYSVPTYFQSDWLNEYLLAQKKQDYRFVYMGPKDSWTPFHSDVYSSFSWSVNIVGTKRWIFMEAGNEEPLKDAEEKLPFSIDVKDLQDRGIPFVEIFQEPNEAVFVPSGWFHQVWNLSDTISINHNWFNGTQLNRIWEALKANLGLVVEELRGWDVSPSEDHLMVMLKASFGMNYGDFLDILEFISIRRIKGTNQNDYQCYDLERIRDIAKIMLEEERSRFSPEDQQRLQNLQTDVLLEINQI